MQAHIREKVRRETLYLWQILKSDQYVHSKVQTRRLSKLTLLQDETQFLQRSEKEKCGEIEYSLNLRLVLLPEIVSGQNKNGRLAPLQALCSGLFTHSMYKAYMTAIARKCRLKTAVDYGDQISFKRGLQKRWIQDQVQTNVFRGILQFTLQVVPTISLPSPNEYFS